MPKSTTPVAALVNGVSAGRLLPVVDIHCIAILLVVPYASVVQMVDEGRFPWVFDLSRGTLKRKMHTPFADALEVILGRMPKARTFEEILESMFGRIPGQVRTSTLTHAFSVREQIIYSWIEDGSLSLVKKGERAISFESVRAFIFSRRVSP